MNKENKNLSRSELIANFVISNSDYYIKEFKKIGSKRSYSFSFNLFASLLGPIWFGTRNIWNYALAFLIIETISFSTVLSRDLVCDASAISFIFKGEITE